MRAHAAVVAAVTLTGLLVAPSSAVGVAGSCGGQPATIVAASNSTTTGTEGDDVIVGHDGVTIDALGGNDLICLDSGFVTDGLGDDSVLVTGTDASKPVAAQLGGGNDRFVGGPGDDAVDELDDVSSGLDDVWTGAGADSVSTPVDPAAPLRLVVDLGSGRDRIGIRGGALGSSIQVQGGTGPDQLDFTPTGSGNHVVDLGGGVIASSGVQTASFGGFEAYYLVGRSSGLQVLGTPGPDHLTLSAKRLDVQLGGGPDSLYLDSENSGIPKSGVIDLGADEDFLDAGFVRWVVGDLARGRLVLKNSQRHRGRMALQGTERLQAGAIRLVVLRGGSGPDWLAGYGCHIRVSGGAGPDRILANSYAQSSGCGGLVDGGPGRDHLIGGHADDVLKGGPGNDEAHGRAGTDTCRAEREFSCEAARVLPGG